MLRVARLEGLLWVAGVLCAACCFFFVVQARMYGHLSGQISKPMAVSTNHEVATPKHKEATSPNHPLPQDVIGRLDIPALALSVPVSSDYDVGSLRKGVGHIRGTAMPGGLGTVGIAGHRDSFFRPLRRIVPKTDIRLTDEAGTYHYTVDSTEVVTPDKVEVLAVGSRPQLTLVTCFPFDYIGPAPKRFIVHAHLVSASPDAAPTTR